MEKLSLFTTPKNGKIGKIVAKQIVEYLVACDNKRVKFTVEKVTAKRSLQQNSYMHVLFSIFAAEMSKLGAKMMPKKIKDMMKFKYLQVEEFDEQTGEILGIRIKGTSELNKDQMGEFLEKVICYAAETYHIILPLPFEQLEIED